MKNLIKKLFICSVSIVLFSCSNDDEKDNSITGIASRNENLSLLVQALKKAGLDTTLKSGSYTVFAPDNDAFIEAGYTSEAITNLPSSGVPALKELLLNHVVAGAVQSSNLTNNSYIKTLGKGAASSSNTLSMYVQTSPNVKLNGIAMVTTPNIIASNGVVHIVDKIIPLPTVVTHATANSNFSTLASLLTNQNLVSTLNGTQGSPFTVFAPLNSAFDTATLGLYSGLSNEDKTSVLLYHVVGGANVLSTAIPTTPITTLQTGTFTIAGTVITDENNRQTNIVLTDVQCSNGVIHAIDKVLLPSL